MIGVPGIGGVPELVSGSRVQGRTSAASLSTGAPTDDLNISATARAAASDSDGGLRDTRVAETRQRIEEGTHKLQDVVAQVAARLSKFVD